MNFGNFTVNQLSDETRIDYHKNAKDWIDVLLALILGFGACGFVVLMYVHTHFNQPIFWIVGSCFTFFGLWKLSDGFLRLVQSSRSVVVILKDKKLVTARYTPWKTTEVAFEDISSILLKGKNVGTYAESTTRYQIYMTLQIVTKDGRQLPVLNINPKKLFNTSNEDIEMDEYEIGQGLANLLAEETGVKYRYEGFERTYTY